MDEGWDDDAPVVVSQSWTSNRNDEQDGWANDEKPSYQSRNWGGENRYASQNQQFQNSSRSEQRNWRDSKFNQSSNKDNKFNQNNRRDQHFQRNRSDEKCEVLRVASKNIGKIIGRGGSKISELQTVSGARIQVTRETEGDETVVKLFGIDETIEKAKNLIDELTTEKIKIYEVKDLPPEPPKPNVDWKQFLKDCEEAEKREWAKYPPIIKQFYQEHPEVTRMTEDQVKQFRLENNNIVVDRTFKKEESLPIPKPCPEFYHAFHQYPEILEEIQKAGFERPSPIQAQAWPVLLSGEDLIGIAQTGTGKTLAFLLPALIHIDGQTTTREQRKGPAVLVMAPTRELALQIDKEIKKYQYKNINSVCIYGGGNRREQVQVVTDGVDIVIATPGRMNDLVAAGHLNVKSVTYAVLDEADRMLDMGFEPQIRKVMYSIRPTRQTIMTSATWPPGVRRLAESYMNDPIQIYIGTLDLAATHSVSQIIQMLPDDDNVKMETFMNFARNLTQDEKVIVFCGRKSRADELSAELALAGVQCQSLHGDRDQADREQALLDIKDGTVQILIATDLASRGLDIDDITHVVNYDFPRNIEEYVHRVGRTGRAGKFGKSISYLTKTDWAQASELIKILEEAEQLVPQEVYDMADRYAIWKEKKDRERDSSRGGRGGRGRGTRR
ncbi:probable ATP-dependent RNA helicase DDX43 isoform X2 [Diorhabda sublineata]|nr:probable ATP-dependent RNA helicase DDX43 isoform X2 [Diorhabda sublineata]